MSKQSKNPENSFNEREHYSKAILEPSVNSSIAIHALYSSINFGDEDGNHQAKGLDAGVLERTLKTQQNALRSGDLDKVENMLLSQAHTLDSIFTLFITKMAHAKYLEQVETFARIALKAQNQTRQTLATLGELKNPRRTTFIQQQNNAVNQQINHGKYYSSNDGNKNPKNSMDDENELLEVLSSERLDSGTQTTAGRVDQTVETVGKIKRPKN